jgi:hypothetical protein
MASAFSADDNPVDLGERFIYGLVMTHRYSWGKMDGFPYGIFNGI